LLEKRGNFGAGGGFREVAVQREGRRQRERFICDEDNGMKMMSALWYGRMVV